MNEPYSEERNNYIKGNIHYQRRLVSTFYQNLTFLYINKVLSKKYVFGNWTKGDLGIIENIIEMEKNIAEETNTKPNMKTLRDMKNMYEASKEYG